MRFPTVLSGFLKNGKTIGKINGRMRLTGVFLGFFQLY